MPRSYRARRIALLLLAALAGALWLQLDISYRVEEDHARLLVRSMAHAVARQIGGSLGAIDQVLVDVAATAAAGRWEDGDRRELLANRLRSLPEVRYLALVGADARLHPVTVPDIGLRPEVLDVSHRDYVRQDKTAPVVGMPIVEAGTGARAIPLSRPVLAADGSRIGTAVAMIAADHYADMLAANMLEAEGATAVIRLDGLMLARSPDHAAKFGINIASSDLFTELIPEAPMGARKLLSKADGNHKFVGYHVLEDYGLVVTSGLTTATALASWRSMAVTEGIALALLAMFVLHWGWRTDRREAQLIDHRDELEHMVAERTGLLEEAMRVANQRAAQLAATHATLARLSQVAAHQLQEPVRPMVSFAQLARRSLVGSHPEVDEHLAFIEGAGLRLKATLLVFQACIELLSGPPRRTAVDLRALATRLGGEMRPALREAGAALDIGPLPVIVADEKMIEGALRELIANALGSRHPDRPLTISVSGAESDAGWRVLVSDSGQGVHGFVEPDPHAAEPNGATGLGLAMCQAIAQAHGGRIVVDSSQAGTGFLFELPRP